LSYQEHQIVKDLIKQLKTMDVQSSDYKERFAELKEAVLDHASEEEELIFPAARLKLDLNALGNEMQQRRIALVSSMAA
jgi:hemerythrin superfamily protein